MKIVPFLLLLALTGCDFLENKCPVSPGDVGKYNGRTVLVVMVHPQGKWSQACKAGIRYWYDDETEYVDGWRITVSE